MPSLSVAVAAIGTDAGYTNRAPGAGEVIATVGATFALTVKATGDDVVVAPRLSVALDVSVYVPSGTLFHV